MANGIQPRQLEPNEKVLLRFTYAGKSWMLTTRPGRKGRSYLPDGHRPDTAAQWLRALRKGSKEFDAAGSRA
jgi:hypothetical protein